METAIKQGLKQGFKLTLPEGSQIDQQSPIVVVLGWYGAQDRHVAKYSNLVNRQGYVAVRATLPPFAVFSPLHWPRRSFAARLLDFLEGLQPALGERQIVFYVFSNGGGFALEQVDWLVRHVPRYRHFASRIAGTAFDSAPCYMHPRVGARAAREGLSLPLRLLATALFYLSVIVLAIVSPFRPQRYWQNMQQLQLGRKSIYLYSQDDPLCDPAKLDELVAARRRQLGAADVAAVKWEESQHVAHLRCHTKEYTAALFGFLQSLKG